MSCLKPNKKSKWSLEFTGRLGANLCICEHAKGFIILAQFTQKVGRIIKPLQYQKDFFIITYVIWSKIAIGLLVSLFSTTETLLAFVLGHMGLVQRMSY